MKLNYVEAKTFKISIENFCKSQKGFLDNLFNIVSAVSTTGLTTNSLKDSYSIFGQLVFLVMFQLGGIGYMSISSFTILSIGNSLSSTREKILSSEYTIPKGFNINDDESDPVKDSDIAV
ncbi:MAG: hypothetical protein EBS19_07190 [Spirochaetia bacterium]|nr:hypothetical protein [Spirochaetia bacterium]